MSRRRPSTRPSSRREAKAAATGKTPGGRPPQPPQEGARPSDQINLTDGIPHHAGGGRGVRAVL